jgi:two-component system, OmpR family, response regulator ResD
MKLLIVDDNPAILQVLSAIITHFGHGVDEAGDGLEAVRLLEQCRYDVVVTDADMPRFDGVQLCKFLKAKLPDIHIVGMSGDLSSLKELENAGADICLPKPFGLKEFQSAIEDRFHASLPRCLSPRATA